MMLGACVAARPPRHVRRPSSTSASEGNQDGEGYQADDRAMKHIGRLALRCLSAFANWGAIGVVSDASMKSALLSEMNEPSKQRSRDDRTQRPHPREEHHRSFLLLLARRMICASLPGDHWVYYRGPLCL